MTEALQFRRSQPVQTIMPPLTEKERVIAYLMHRYDLTRFQAEGRYRAWESINDIREVLGIK